MPHFGQRSRLYGMRRLYASRWNVICEMPFPSSLRVIRRLVGAVCADGQLSARRRQPTRTSARTAFRPVPALHCSQRAGLYQSKVKARDVGMYESGCGWR